MTNPKPRFARREKIEQLKFLNKEEIKRDGVKKEGPKDGEIRKEWAKDPPRKVIKEDEPRKVIKEGERREFRIELKGDEDGEGKLAAFAAMVKKLMAENQQLRNEIAEIRGGEYPVKEKVPLKEKGPIKDKEGAGGEKEAARESEEAKREISDKSELLEKETFKRALAERGSPRRNCSPSVKLSRRRS